MENFKERMLSLMRELDTNPNDLAGKLGTSAVNIYGYLNGRASVPSMKMLNKFANIGVNPEWLRTGEGNMFLQDDKELTGVPRVPNENDYLMKYLERIENGYETTVLEKDKIIQYQLGLIESQKNFINMLKTQLTSVLGKFDVSEETSPADAEKGREVEFIPEKEEPKKQAA